MVTKKENQYQERARLTALITGASSGIGLELARVFAANGYNLILTARSKAKLDELAEELRSKYKTVEVHVLPADLSCTGAAGQLFHETEGLGLFVDVLVNNAGLGRNGWFHELDEAADAEVMQVNMIALTELTKAFIRPMLDRGAGRILNVASTGSYQPGPYIAVYYATKAYVLSLSEALAHELKGSGITVTALCPGATRTGFAGKAGKQDLDNAMSAQQVAEAGYRGLMRGRRVVIPGLLNRMMVTATKIMPRSWSAAIVSRIQRHAAAKQPNN